MTQIAPITSVRRRNAVSAAVSVNPVARSGAAASATVFMASARGGSMSVRERFDTLVARFKPDAAKGVDVRFQFDLSGDGGGEWYVTIKDGKVTVKKGTGPDPTATLKASASDYKKIADGDMSKTWAFLRGKLKVEGDKDELSKFDTYFQKP